MKYENYKEAKGIVKKIDDLDYDLTVVLCSEPEVIIKDTVRGYILNSSKNPYMKEHVEKFLHEVADDIDKQIVELKTKLEQL